MDPIEKILWEMSNSYQSVSFKKDLSGVVQDGILRHHARFNLSKLLGIIFMGIIIAVGIIEYKNLSLTHLGSHYSVLIYLTLSFFLMSFIIIITINSQKFLIRFLGSSLLKKINHQKCYFSFEDEEKKAEQRVVK